MSRMFRIPAELVRPLRIGLHGELGSAAQEIERVSDRYGRHRHPEWYEEPLAYFDTVRALLDEIGWGEPPEPTEIDVDLTKYERPVLSALRSQVCVHRDMVAETESVIESGRSRASHRRVPPRSRAQRHFQLCSPSSGWRSPTAEVKAPDPGQEAAPTD